MRQGFTIVELLIVVVVIAILASITIVSYSGIQNQAYIAKTKSDFRIISQAIEGHRGEHGAWPLCDSGNDFYSQCNITEIVPKLFDKNIPTRTGKAGSVFINYVVMNNEQRWAVAMRNEAGAVCKVGYNTIATWYVSAPSCW